MTSKIETDDEHDDIIYPSAIPFILVHLGCFAAIWTGVKAFEYAWEAAHDVHLDLAHGSRRFSSCVA